MTVICAVVLTYNRQALLSRCLEALLKQTRACDRILVIDNASTDGTSEMLAREWKDRVDVRSLAKNIGAAGGYNLGFRIAYELGSDLLWAMDDDVIVDPEALERLMDARAGLATRGIDPPYLVSMARATSGALTEVPDIDRRANSLGFPNWGEFLSEGIVPILAATFASILVPRETIRRYGLPIGSMFIFGEDREYTLRITQDNPGYAVGSSRVLHARKLDGVLDIRSEGDPARLRYHYYLHRNTTYTLLRYERPSRIALHLWRQARLLLGLAVRGDWRRAGIVARGAAAGFFYRPTIEVVGESAERLQAQDPGISARAAEAT